MHDPAMAPRRRRPFPGRNPQPIRCPDCGRDAHTSPDGLTYECTAGHTGYYDTPHGILPDSAWRGGTPAARAPVERFAGELAFLSNFHRCAIELDGADYPSLEHAFQAAKTADPRERERIRRAPTPGQAKRLGRSATLRPGWDRERVQVMRALVLQKFTRHPELKERLLATGGRELVEGNDWGDRFWGVCGGQGENRLGRILMEVRAYLAGLRDAGGAT